MRTIALLLALLAPAGASAFCGFFVSGADQALYNRASHVVLMRKGNHTVMSMSVDYHGPPSDFAMVVPVPVVLQKKQVKTLRPDVFRHVDELTAPRLVEYWEQDPCGGGGYGIGGGSMARPAARGAAKMADGDDGGKYGVKVEARFTAGEYDVVILSAQQSDGLEAYLRANNYKIPTGAAAALAPYVAAQTKFFVAKVDPKKVKFDAQQRALLSPLQFSFDSNELRLPVRLGLLNNEGKQDLIVWVMHPSKRYEVANYPNLFVPTNLEVTAAVKKGFGSFYAELFDEVLRRNNNRGVATEYSWDTGSCDPCPGPPLDENDLATLGSVRLGGGYDWVVTRLHARYDKESLSEDLVFRAAPPLQGGRGERDDGGGPHGAHRSDDGTNNYQQRYIVRHWWARKISCDKPQRGMWGGPPDGREERFTTARDLAGAARGQLKLVEVVKTAVPSLGLPGKKK